MDLIDFAAAEHVNPIAKILDLARWPHHCIVTKRAMEDIVKLRLTKDAVLDALRCHLIAKRRTYFLMQEIGVGAYVLLPAVSKLTTCT